MKAKADQREKENKLKKKKDSATEIQKKEKKTCKIKR